MSGSLMFVDREFDGSMSHEVLTPSIFSLPTVTNATPSAWTTGSFSTAGTSCRITVQATNCFVSLNNSTWVTSLIANQGVQVYWKAQAAPGWNAQISYSIQAGTATRTAFITTSNQDITPDVFTLTSWTNATPFQQYGGSFVVSGLNTLVSVTCTNCLVSADSVTYASTVNAYNGTTISYMLNAPAGSSTTMGYSITVGDLTENGSITTISQTYANPITIISNGAGWVYSYCQYAKASGKWFYEATFVTSSGGRVSVDAGTCYYDVTGAVTVGVALDYDGRMMYVYDTSGNLLASRAMGGTAGLAYKARIGTSYGYPSVNMGSAQFGTSAFQCPVPTGYNAGIWA